MENIPLLSELGIILIVTAPVVFLFQKLKLPPIVGFLVAGVVLGPSVSGLVKNQQHIESFVELGVILLLFTIGLEFPFSNLKRLRKQMLVGGTLQVLATGAVIFAVTFYFGWNTVEALILGFLISLSSTAIVFKLLLDRGEIDSPHGMMATGILLFQDLCVVPMVLVIQALGNQERLPWNQAAFAFGKALAVMTALWLFLRLLLPVLLSQIARLRNRELFALFIILLIVGTAWVTQWIGLSTALGAFLVGLLLAESDFAHEVMAEISPLRNVLFSLFFISIGMLLDVAFLGDNWKQVIGFTALVLGGKAVLVGMVVYFLSRSFRLSVFVGIALAQVGEFSFVLAQMAQNYHLMTGNDYQGFLCTAIVSMIVTPFALKLAPHAAFWAEKPGAEKKMAEGKQKPVFEKGGHVIILGFGMNGQNLGRVLTETHIPFVVVDMNLDLIRMAKERNYPTIYGDGSHREILEKAGIENGRVLVLAISDPPATRRILALARSLNKNLTLIVRTRQAEEIDQLYRMGATQVISEEFETSVEIFSRVLEDYRIPRNITQMQVNLVRKDRYSMFRGLSLSSETLASLPALLAETTVETVALLETSPAVGKSLADLNLRQTTGAQVIAMIRQGKSGSPDPHEKLQAGDTLILVGSHAQLDHALPLFSPTPQ